MSGANKRQDGKKMKKKNHLVVGPDCRGLPPPVVPARVAVVELEAVVAIPAGEEERHAERPKTPELCVRLYINIKTNIYYKVCLRERTTLEIWLPGGKCSCECCRKSTNQKDQDACINTKTAV